MKRWGFLIFAVSLIASVGVAQEDRDVSRQEFDSQLVDHHVAVASPGDIHRAPARSAQTAQHLAGLGIPATAGFGVHYQGLHGTDERIRLDSIPAVQAVYHQALLTLLHAG